MLTTDRYIVGLVLCSFDGNQMPLAHQKYAKTLIGVINQGQVLQQGENQHFVTGLQRPMNGMAVAAQNVTVFSILSAHDPFPPIEQAWGEETDAPGLLCAGADLSPERLLAAYQRGIFPWFNEGQPILWWSTQPRMVLHTHEFKLHPSLGKRIKQWRNAGLEVRMDSSTPQVIQACADASRHGQSGTWIVPAMQAAYARMAQLGHVHSVEAWMSGQLAGGLYCVAIGKAVFGESMFHAHTDGSKVALAALVAFCRSNGVQLIDCQQQTSHLARFGARPIARSDFQRHLKAACNEAAPVWRFDPLYWDKIYPPKSTPPHGPPQ